MSDIPTIIVVESDGSVTVETADSIGSVDVDVTMPEVDVIDVGSFGPMGTPVVAVPFYEWPPINAQDDVLYLRLAP